jgi:anti-sigma factor RsiW
MTGQHLTDEQLSAYIDHAVAHKDAAAIADHLERCQDCTGRVHLLRATSQAVASLPEQEMPRPIDFGFLGDRAAAPPEPSRGFVARVIQGRPPSWLPTMVAAAAVFALVATWIPRLVPAPGGPSQTAAGLGASRSPGGALFAPNNTKLQPGGPGQGSAALAPPANQADAQAAPQPALSKTAVAPDGSTLSLLANPPSANTGHPVQVLLRLVGGPRGTDLAPPGMEIFVSQNQNQLRLGGSEGTSRTLRAGEELDLTLEWSAGALTGPPAPGTYSLTGRIFLKNSTVVEVPLTFTAS